MPRRKKSGSKQQSKTLVYVAWILTFIAVALSSIVAGYYFGYDDAKKEAVKKEQIKEEKRFSVLKKLEDSSAKKEESDVNNRLKEVLKKESKTITEDKEAKEEKEVKAKDANQTKIEKTKEAVKEYEDASHEVEGTVLPAPPKREIVKISTKPKLAIIIDDVSVKSHISAVESLNLPITMSFLPPSELRPNSHVLASKEKFYMVHLPMEAQNFKREEPFTLKVEDSEDKILQRIIEIKKLFPRVKYINNHAGSKFTSDEAAVRRLIHSLNEQNISFIDSRTIGESKVPIVMKSYKKQYVGRDVFLDHQVDKNYIKSQIKKAIEVAKMHGSAIAIGHPHANTILAIDESKHLFKDVELVLVDKLY
ncbi:MAG: divergent polysaccharide deacetylase family protein [Sulfurimonas sp.]|uniref:divergent polysaccharide deacetylase family protein n=1 Tax=Sulfurimonas sp. TaxID=2022749 RepID=UPI00262DFF5F|nr:divergent polysaccharide deacetylase family protein [Sulfurimonas sp.]MDD5373415.1 divergent polysaccharide deacetylase family protein [Sulfurimonas sp.]